MMSIMVMMITALFDTPVVPHFFENPSCCAKVYDFFPPSVCISVS